MDAAVTAGQPPITPAAQAALAKFLELVDDLGATRDVTRRVLFEFLRSKSTLSVDEVENLEAIEQLLADLDRARRA